MKRGMYILLKFGFYIILGAVTSIILLEGFKLEGFKYWFWFLLVIVPMCFVGVLIDTRYLEPKLHKKYKW